MAKQFFLGIVYLLSWAGFALLALLFNAICAVLLLLPTAARPACGIFVRRTLHYFFRAFLGWTTFSRIVKVSWHGFDSLPVAKPAVWVANHPGLIDSTFLIARLPNACCVFKAAMRANPFFAPAAVLGGFTPGDLGSSFIRDAVKRLSEGCSMIVFPEGTRTNAGVDLNPLKPGFALIAAHASVPVQVVVIRAARDLLGRGRPWWRMPHFPVLVEVRADIQVPAFDSDGSRQAVAFVESRLAEALRPVCVGVEER